MEKSVVDNEEERGSDTDEVRGDDKEKHAAMESLAAEEELLVVEARRWR